jgi:hypothetical protein
MKDLQDTPLNHGWKWTEKDESARVRFGVPYDAPAVGSLAIIPSVFYGIDFKLQQGWILADRLKYSANYIGMNAALYTFVTIGFRNGDKDDQLWIAHTIGSFEHRLDGVNSKNWVVYLPGEPIGNGWRVFDASVSDEVRQIFQDRGGFLRQVTMLSLRGHISISPIEGYETQRKLQ